MKVYEQLTADELLKLKDELKKQYEETKGKGLSLNMARGKPSDEQLDLSMDMLNIFSNSTNPFTESGIDTRNYGETTGIPEAKALIGGMIDAPADNVIICGNSALNIMYDTVSRSMSFGVCGSTPWHKLDKVRFLCPSPGYDRHFAITELFGIEMITIPMLEDGPDMDMVREYVTKDASVKGIWCVPKYSNPQGIVYSDRVVEEFAALKPAAEDFRIYWDNAYAVHDLYEDSPQLMNIFEACEKYGSRDMFFEFASTSKVCFAGGGISAVAASENNLKWIERTMTIQTIGSDKMNQYRHVLYFRDADGIKRHMKKQAKILKPKFDVVLECLERELGAVGLGRWTKPKGGYFVCFIGLPGTAKRVVSLCRDAGLVMTAAGATFPYGVDPEDSTIRIAPSFPTVEEMRAAVELFVLCVKIASIEKLLE